MKEQREEIRRSEAQVEGEIKVKINGHADCKMCEKDPYRLERPKQRVTVRDVLNVIVKESHKLEPPRQKMNVSVVSKLNTEEPHKPERPKQRMNAAVASKLSTKERRRLERSKQRVNADVVMKLNFKEPLWLEKLKQNLSVSVVSKLNFGESHGQEKPMKDEEHRTRLAEERNIRRVPQQRRSSDLSLAAFHYNSEIRDSESSKISVGEMDETCDFCAAKKFAGEAPGMCCKNGSVR